MIGNVYHTDNGSLSGLADFAQEHAHELQKGIVSSVIQLSEDAKAVLQKLPFNVLEMSSTTPLPTSSVYVFPPSMGTDRIAADVAAINAASGHPVLVFDAGTCLTVELLTPKEGLVGGVISPGLNMRLVSMHEHTSALPLIDGSKLSVKGLWGTDTPTAMFAGVTNGMTFEIEGYIHRLLPYYPDLVVFVTGGNTFSFDKMLNHRIIQDKLLLLHGLNEILEFNNRFCQAEC